MTYQVLTSLYNYINYVFTCVVRNNLKQSFTSHKITYRDNGNQGIMNTTNIDITNDINSMYTNNQWGIVLERIYKSTIYPDHNPRWAFRRLLDNKYFIPSKRTEVRNIRFKAHWVRHPGKFVIMLNPEGRQVVTREGNGDQDQGIVDHTVKQCVANEENEGDENVIVNEENV